MELNLKAGRVAFLGSALASRSFAPFGDDTWEIWATGPGCHNQPEFQSQFDRWFELHDMSENDPQYGTVIDPGYFEWLQRVADEKTIYFRPPLYPGMKGELFPWDEIKARHSGYFLDSTVAWMMAFLLEYGEVDEIGLFGIDFSTDEERVKQRKGAKHFCELFRAKGVKITIPEVSEMSFDPSPYPELSTLGKKFDRHLRILEPQAAETEKQIAQKKAEIADLELHLERIRGTMQTLMFFKDNWT